MKSEEQTNLYGYKDDFKKFSTMYNNGTLPNKFYYPVMKALANVHSHTILLIIYLIKKKINHII